MMEQARLEMWSVRGSSRTTTDLPTLHLAGMKLALSILLPRDPEGALRDCLQVHSPDSSMAFVDHHPTNSHTVDFR
jgi:hypothetical protein